MANYSFYRAKGERAKQKNKQNKTKNETPRNSGELYYDCSSNAFLKQQSLPLPIGNTNIG